MNTAYRLVRIRQALVVRDTLATIVREIDSDDGSPAAVELLRAGVDLDGLKDHLERAARLTDPVAAEALARRADEPYEARRSVGS